MGRLLISIRLSSILAIKIEQCLSNAEPGADFSPGYHTKHSAFNETGDMTRAKDAQRLRYHHLIVSANK
jgi:hypothetical protein